MRLVLSILHFTDEKTEVRQLRWLAMGKVGSNQQNQNWSPSLSAWSSSLSLLKRIITNKANLNWDILKTNLELLKSDEFWSLPLALPISLPTLYLSFFANSFPAKGFRTGLPNVLLWHVDFELKAIKTLPAQDKLLPSSKEFKLGPCP